MAEVVDLYGRVSTAEQAAEGYSIGEQESRLRKYADAQGWVVHQCLMDGGYSGGNMDRPALTALIADARAHRITKVVVYKLDRLSRSQKDTLYLIEDVFIKEHISFTSMTENLDTGTPLGMAMIGILSTFAQLERSQIAERMMVGRDARAKEGKFHGGALPPFGYDYTDGNLILNKYEAAQVKMIHDMYLEGMPYLAISNEMIRRGLKTRYGEWSHRAVKRVAEENLYIYEGKLQWRGEYYDGQHEPLVTPDKAELIRAEALRRETGNKRKGSAYKRRYLLSGLIFCGKCGRRYEVQSKQLVTKMYRVYICHGRKPDSDYPLREGESRCQNKIWDMNELNEIILAEIRKLSADPSAVESIAGRVEQETARDEIQAHIADIDKQIDRLIDLLQSGLASSGKVAGRISALEEERDRLTVSLAEESKAPAMSVESARTALTAFSALNAEDYTIEQLQPIVSALINKIVVDDGNIEINWNFE